MKERVYIAGPYSATTQNGIDANVHRAAVIAVEVMRMGHMAHCPHTATHLLEVIDQRQKLGYEDYMALDFSIIEHWATVVLKFDKSPGADREETFAKERGIRVVYRTEELALVAVDEAR